MKIKFIFYVTKFFGILVETVNFSTIRETIFQTFSSHFTATRHKMIKKMYEDLFHKWQKNERISQGSIKKLEM